MNKIIDGKETANKVKDESKKRIEILSQKGIQPHLVVVLIGEDPASQVYVRNKETACKNYGIKSTLIQLDEKITSEADILKIIHNLNKDTTVHGILVQFPLPKKINEHKIKSAISPLKDVDCFNPINIGLFFSGQTFTTPCTPGGVMRLLKEYNVSLDGKTALIIGRSLIAGKPMAELLNQQNATTILAHSRTPKEILDTYLKTADIIVSAINEPNHFKAEQLGKDQILIDIGICRNEENKLCGNFDHSCYENASLYTPVPGGVGPMTISTLIQNTLHCAENLA